MGLKSILKGVGKLATGNILGGAASIAGGIIGSKGSKSAANAQVAGNQQAIDEQRRQFDVTQANQAPWLAAGRTALTNLSDPNAFHADPGYQFSLDQSQRAIEHSAAARGGAFSGNTGRALQTNAIGLADQNYGNWWNRQAGIAGLGQNSANNLGTFGANAANQIGGLLSGSGDARASGIVGSTNSTNAGLGGAVGYATDALKNYFAPKPDELAPFDIGAIVKKRIGKVAGGL